MKAIIIAEAINQHFSGNDGIYAVLIQKNWKEFDTIQDYGIMESGLYE